MKKTGNMSKSRESPGGLLQTGREKSRPKAETKKELKPYKQPAPLCPSKGTLYSWGIKLNIMIMAFLFIVFIKAQTESRSFQETLKNIFGAEPAGRGRSVRIQISPSPAKLQKKIKQEDFE